MPICERKVVMEGAGPKRKPSSSPEPTDHPVKQHRIAAREKQPLYVHSEGHLVACLTHPRLEDRALLVHTLIDAYGLLDYLSVEAPTPAPPTTLVSFHSQGYLDVLLDRTESDDQAEGATEELKEYGLEDDCPPFPELRDYVLFVAGGSLHAATALSEKRTRRAIHWGGGWHHAEKDRAAGFCYVNDIVLAIIQLRKTFQRVLYIDLDLHHGDAVEGAFYTSPNVLTLSLHKHAPGFFPGTGKATDIGKRAGKYYAINVPLPNACKDETFTRVFISVANAVLSKYQPDVVVVQCGADGLQTDPNAALNLTTKGYGACVSHVLSWDLPTLFLGGGGYNFSDTARCWTYLTGLIAGVELSDDLPDHDHLDSYGPGYQLHTTEGNRPEGKFPGGGEKEALEYVLGNVEQLQVADD